MSKSNAYHPPFTITPAILRLVAEIAEAVGRLSAQPESARELRLRRINQVRAIQGTLAIEGNTLNQEQITALLEGKRVAAPPREIQEARNAIAAYDIFEQWIPHSESDLLKAHSVLMAGLLGRAGRYRVAGVGVLAGDKTLPLAPPALRIPALMDDLLQWLRTTEHHPLIAASVFHYEFEFIHPFDDGSGRLGRLWQTLILTRWNSLFKRIPVESQVHKHQAEYYQSLQNSTRLTNCTQFIEFMLTMILDAVRLTVAPSATHLGAHPVSPQIVQLLRVFVERKNADAAGVASADNAPGNILGKAPDNTFGALSREELQNALNLQNRKSFSPRYLTPALEQGLIQMTLPGKPGSRLQKYYLTGKGQRFSQG